MDGDVVSLSRRSRIRVAVRLPSGISSLHKGDCGMSRSLLLLLALILLVAPALAGTLVERDLYVYTRDIAYAVEIHTVDVDRGMNTVRIDGMPEWVLTGSLAIRVPGDGAEVTTHSIAYTDATLDEDMYWESWIGEEITVEVDDDEFTGVLRLVTDDALYFDDEDGLLHVDRDDLDDDLFPLPATLSAGPSVLWTCEARRCGDLTVELSYLTEGLSWEGEHRVVLDPVTGLATMDPAGVVLNETAARYTCDRLHLVAGAIHLAGDRRRVDRLNPQAGAMRDDDESRVGDLRRWTVTNATLLPHHETRFAIQARAASEFTRSYVYDATVFDDRTSLHAEFTLNRPVPAGDTRVFDAHGDELLFTGEDRIDDTPAGSPIDLTLGQVFDITAERTRVSEGRAENGNTVQVFDVYLGNSRDEDVVVTVLERLFGEWTVTTARIDEMAVDHERRDARTAAFAVPVPAGETRTLRYEIEYAR